MNRRHFLYLLGSIPLTVAAAKLPGNGSPNSAEMKPQGFEKINRTDAEWRRLLSPEQYEVLRREGTERPFTSPLNGEKRPGRYVCAGCELPLFTSEMKFDSGTGWPSFFTALPNSTETKSDFKLIIPRTEYHCARCGGHQGHLFNDGPQPSGERWCNNGLALKFIPA